MKYVVSLLGLFLIMTVSAWSHPEVQASEDVVARHYKEGQFWRFRLTERGGDPLDYNTSRLADGIYEIIFSENQLNAFYVGSEQTKQALDPAHPTLRQMLGLDKDFQFPLSIGREWTYSYTQRISVPAPATPAFHFLRHTVHIMVSGLEEVTTRAGTFRAFKLVKDDKLDTSWRRLPATMYFSEETQSIVRLNGVVLGGRRRTVELIRYGVIPSATPVVRDPSAPKTGDVGSSPTVQQQPPVSAASTKLEASSQQIIPPSTTLSPSASSVLPPVADRLELLIDQ